MLRFSTTGSSAVRRPKTATQLSTKSSCQRGRDRRAVVIRANGVLGRTQRREPAYLHRRREQRRREILPSRQCQRGCVEPVQLHVDSSCGPVNNKVVSGNTINEACAGIRVGTAAGSNSIGSNTFFNARNTVLTADSCTPPLIAARPANTSSVNTSSVAKSPRPSPAGPEIKRTPSQTGRLKLLTVCAPL